MTGEGAALGVGRRGRPARGRRTLAAADRTIDELTRAAGQAEWPTDRSWRLRSRAGGLDLVAERSSRRAVLAAGAALLNVRLALADAGVEPIVVPVPADRPDVLARVEPGGARLPVDPSDNYLYGELQGRRAGAPRFAVPGLPPGVASHLSALVEIEQARLLPLGDGWSGDQAPAAGVLVTDGDGVLDWLRAGQAVQRLHLAASAAWLAVRCDLDALDVPHVRERVRRDHCPDGVPQVMLELGQRTAPVA